MHILIHNVVSFPLNSIFLFLFNSFSRLAVNEKAEHVAKCTEEVCTSLIEETVNADIALLVDDILETELQRIHKYIKR